VNTTKTFLLTALVSAGLMAAQPGQAQVSISVNLPGISVNLNDAPPPPRVEVMPDPRRGFVWHPGYWNWNGNAYVWIAGVWVKERPGFIWVPPRWVEHNGRWEMDKGRWNRHQGGDWRAAQQAQFKQWDNWRQKDMKREWHGPGKSSPRQEGHATPHNDRGMPSRQEGHAMPGNSHNSPARQESHNSRGGDHHPGRDDRDDEHRR